MPKLLSQMRNAKNKTQREVAEDLNVGISTIGMYETGQRTPNLQTAKRLAAYFGVSVENIFFGNCVQGMRVKNHSKDTNIAITQM